MSRRAVPLTVEVLDELPDECRTCLFWEADAVRRPRVDDPVRAKREWVREVTWEWGTCGQVLQVDGRVAGHLVYAPAPYLPGAAELPTAPCSPDAVVLATAYVDPALRGQGLGKVLVQAMARDLVRRGDVAGVEAFATRVERNHLRGCLLPEEFLAAVGFTTQRAHPTTPRLRMDLRSTVPWRVGVGRAIARLRGAVRPSPKPARGQAMLGRVVPTQAMYSSRSLSSAALGLAPTMDFTTSPPE